MLDDKPGLDHDRDRQIQGIDAFRPAGAVSGHFLAPVLRSGRV